MRVSRTYWIIGAVAVPLLAAVIGILPQILNYDPEPDPVFETVPNVTIASALDKDPRMRTLLIGVANDFNDGKWLEVVDYFDQDYAREQIAFLEGGGRPKGQVWQQFLAEAFGIYNHAFEGDLTKVKIVSFTRLLSDDGDFYEVSLEARTPSGVVDGSIMIEKSSLKLWSGFG